ncbi:hypothetical protein F2Q65_14725 [Thiohalocapsa marina]|uniref:Toxin CptA n=1 Tax=Thiohalocapsa marina TaxID=424902 RepID=A0A5M8FHA3_9GAMM|nr:protein YgfX [Thiohalocapsa marina]KAA6183804.1 hypothetical protein F2Q65_14725 [Thiohalocapsa marina]
MSDHRLKPPLRLRLALSRRLLGYVLLVHGMALAVLWLLPPEASSLVWPMRLGVGALVLGSLGFSLWCHVLHRAPWSVVEVAHDDEGWVLTRADGGLEQARLLPSTYVGVGLVVLNFRVGRFRRRSVVLTEGAVSSEALRQVRVRLRTGGG